MWDDELLDVCSDYILQMSLYFINNRCLLLIIHLVSSLCFLYSPYTHTVICEGWGFGIIISLLIYHNVFHFLCCYVIFRIILLYLLCLVFTVFTINFLCLSLNLWWYHFLMTLYLLLLISWMLCLCTWVCIFSQEIHTETSKISKKECKDKHTMDTTHDRITFIVRHAWYEILCIVCVVSSPIIFGAVRTRGVASNSKLVRHNPSLISQYVFAVGKEGG